MPDNEGLPVACIDNIENGRITGWARQFHPAGSDPTIRLEADGRLIAAVRCTLPRPDVNALGIEGRQLGFIIYADLEHVRLLYKSVKISAVYGAKSFPVVFAGHLNEQAKGSISRSYSRPPNSNIIFIDILDVLVYLRSHLRLSGIQRVCSEIIKALSENDRVSFCSSCGKSFVYVHPIQKLLEIMRYAINPFSTHSLMLEMIDECYSDSSLCVPQRGDVYFIAGAFWVDEHIPSLFSEMNRSGVITGVMIYDIIALTNCDFVTHDTRSAMQRRAATTLPGCSFFLTISEFVKKQFLALAEIENIVPGHAAAVPLPRAPEAFRPPSKTRQISNRTSFVLYVSTIEARKNHAQLFRVWAAMLRKFGPSEVPQLVFVGRWGWGVDDFAALLRETKSLNGKIEILNDVSDMQLRELYAECLFTVFPSFAEGWGLPIGESLAAGKLCICSTMSSMPEVGGNLVEFVNPTDYVKTLGAVERLIFDLDYRKRRENEIKQSFDVPGWDDYARRLLAELEIARSSVCVDVEQPPLTTNIVHTFSSGAKGDFDLVSWAAYARITRLLAEGWGSIEPWGVWAVRPHAKIQFVPYGEFSQIRVGLELRKPPSVSGALRVTIGSVDMIAQVGSRPSWVYVDVELPDPHGSVIIEIRAVSEEGYVETGRSIFFGLSQLVLFAPTAVANPLTADLMLTQAPVSRASVHTS